MVWYLIIIVSCLACSTILFGKAAGTLSPTKINVVSSVFYLFMLQTFFGVSLIMLGYDKHYTLGRLINRQETIKVAFTVIMIVSVMFPLCILIIQKLLKFAPHKEYTRYLKKSTEVKNEDTAFIILTLMGGVCILLMLLWFVKIGYIPALKLMHTPTGFDFALERKHISATYLLHPYVSNILVLAAIPLISYSAFAYLLVKKEKKWYILFSILFVASILTKTYNFEKSPVIYYLSVFCLIYIYYKGQIKLSFLIFAGVGMFVLLIGMYKVTGFSGQIADIYNGPIGRTVFSQLGALLCVFDAFPRFFPFLKGRSLSAPLLFIVGMDSSMHLRSGKLMMDFYGSEGIYDGTAGVLNSFFIGEAYANYGFAGVFFSVVWIALVIAVFLKLILSLKKTPLMIAFLAAMTLKITVVTQSGFFDFVFNVDWIFTTMLFLGLYILIDTKNDVCLKVIKRVYSNTIERVKK